MYRIKEEGAAALEGDGDRKLPDRRVRPAAHRLAQHQGSRRLGAEDDEGVGPGERPHRDLAVRPRLAEPVASPPTRSTPRAYPLIAYPKAWTPGTNGPVTGEAVARGRSTRKRTSTSSRASCAASSCSPTAMREVAAHFEAHGHRYTDAGARRALEAAARDGGRGRGNFAAARSSTAKNGAVLHRRRRRRRARLRAAATAARSSCRRRRLARSQGSAARRRRSSSPSSTTAGSSARCEKNIPVTLQIDVDNKFFDDGPERLQHRRRAARDATRPTKSSCSARTSIRGTPAPARPTTPPARR